MTINIRKTDQSLLATVPDGQYNNTVSSLILFGKNFANYGTAINENMVHLMEHFASNSPPPSPVTGQLWYDTISKSMKAWDNGWTLLNASSIQEIANTIVKNRVYVSKSGSDSNTGLSWFEAKLTIKAACAVAATQISLGNFDDTHCVILVAAGDYTEDCPITIPAGTSIIGDNLRSVTVRPRIPISNVFYLNSKNYIFGLTVRDHRLNPSALDLTPVGYANASGAALPRNTTQTGWAFSFAPGADIIVSPYIQNCSSISGDPDTGSGIYPGGGGVLVDSTKLDPASRIHSIVVDAFTQINLGGIGVKVVGKGYMQLVSFFINFCQFGLLCVDGGHVTALNSNCSFGNYSLWAEGSRWLDNAQAVNQVWPVSGGPTSGTNSVDGTNTVFTTNTNTKVQPSQLVDLVVTVNSVIQVINIDYSVTDTASGTESQITFVVPPPAGTTISAKVRFGSLIEASGYTMSYAGAGLDYAHLSPSQGGSGASDPNKYTIALDNGHIFHTTTDESGDFYVGVVTPGDVTNGVQGTARPSFRINQRKGAIDGRAFYQSIFGFMTPFVLALTRKG